MRSEQSVQLQVALTGKSEVKSEEILLRHCALPEEPLASPGVGGCKDTHPAGYKMARPVPYAYSLCQRDWIEVRWVPMPLSKKGNIAQEHKEPWQ